VKPRNTARPIHGGLVEIDLTQNQTTVINAEWWPLVAPHRWAAIRGRHFCWYAQTNVQRPDGRWTTLKLHQILARAMGFDGLADHINGNGLDNRRENLRPATCSQNARNRRVNSNQSTPYIGITLVRGRWRSKHKISLTDSRQTHLGYFDTAEEAAMARDEAVIASGDRFSHLNFPQHHPERRKEAA
jgi:hypothetical protein